MDKKRKAFFIVVLMLTSNMKMCVHGAPLEESIINKDLTGQDLIKMGNSLNKPLLTLLGATFVKTEQNLNKELADQIVVSKNTLQDGIDKLTLELCKEARCAAWSEWSRCSANRPGTFGARTRSRKCGGNSSICLTGTGEKIETDNQICQGKTCTHILTTNMFCIKLDKSVKKSQQDAKEDCQKNGGYLINIDNAVLKEDVVEYLKKISFTDKIWIDGTRLNADWKYTYNHNNASLELWGPSEPGAQDDCKILYYHTSTNKWFWWGRKCTDNYYHLCEIF